MQRWSRLLPLGLAGVAWAACSDGPSGPAPPVDRLLAPVILSDPGGSAAAPALAAAGRGAGAELTFVSLPPGSLPGAASVAITNVSADGTPISVPVVDGGFDPVAIPATEGDELLLEFRGSTGTVLARKAGAVPGSRPPVIVRVSPPKGRTDVALGMRPTVIFSEPMDPATLADAVRLVRAGEAVAGEVSAPPGAPWVAQFTPSTALLPGTEYRLEVGQGVLDADGEALAEALSTEFTTVAAVEPPPAVAQRIAFTSNRSGEWRIYLANRDGSGVVELTPGHSPAWSRDGRMIAFNRGYDVHVINADGSGERLIATGGLGPSWSPDDSQIAFTNERGIVSVGVDGSGETVLHQPSSPYLGWGKARWSPDGERISFEARRGGDYYHAQVMLLGVGDPEAVPLTDEDPSRSGQRDPVWSPEGLRIAFVADSGYPTTGQVIGYALASRLLDGTDLRTHLRPADIAGDPGEWSACCLGAPAWSADGTQLAFVAAHVIRWEDSATRIHVLDIETGLQRQLIPDVPGKVPAEYSDHEVAWSPLAP